MPFPVRLSATTVLPSYESLHQAAYRKSKLFLGCQHLTLLDLEAAEAMIEAYEFAGEPAAIFSQVRTLCLGGPLIWRMGYQDPLAQDIQEGLWRILDIRHLCITLHIGSKIEYLASQGIETDHPSQDDDDKSVNGAVRTKAS